ncbi:MAG: 6-bladed beta-propeller [Balneola sp.]
MDEIKVDTILVDEEYKLGTRISKKFTEPVYLGFPTNSFISLNDSLYVASKQRIYVMDEKGTWQRTVGHKGRGPGEFDSFVKIENNDKHIYAFDYGSSRIHKYDYKLNLVSSVNLTFDYSPLWKSFAFSDTRLYLKSNLNPNDDLISVYDLEGMEGEIETFWPKIIPNGSQPNAYNTVLIDANKNKDLAITHLGTPYLFMFDTENKRIEHVMYFKSSKFQVSENPSLRPIKDEGNSEKARVRTFIKQIILKDNQTIYFTVGKNIYQVIKVDQNYYLNNAWCFVYKNDLKKEGQTKTIDFSSFIIESGSIYFITFLDGYIYRLRLNESV